VSHAYHDEIIRAAHLLCEARYAIALTGAGSSTPSGISDFRTPGEGLWERVNPLEVASIRGFRKRPEAFYGWIRSLAVALVTAEPNAGHLALADLEEGGWLKAVVTQNIDGLHQRAGSREVLELHGHLREATCVACGRKMEAGTLFDRFLASGDVPRCPMCDGVIKPSVVLFGEPLPADVVEAAMVHVGRADLMLVAGSSLEVAPASLLPRQVYEHDGHLIVVNLMSTYIDDVADVVIHADLADVLPRIAQACVEG